MHYFLNLLKKLLDNEKKPTIRVKKIVRKKIFAKQ